jgi:hypothetical protein
MTSSTSGRVLVVKKEEKEAKVGEFLRQALETANATAGGARLLVARSPASPAARALTALQPELARAGIEIHAIFTATDAGELDDARRWGVRNGANVRVLKGAAFLEGHEQLVLGATTAWIGDCMRRDPSQRDAFEFYATDCAKTARMARISFERLWKVASVIPAAPAEKPAPMIDAEVAAAALPQQDDAKPLVSSRH